MRRIVTAMCLCVIASLAHAMTEKEYNEERAAKAEREKEASMPHPCQICDDMDKLVARKVLAISASDGWTFAVRTAPDTITIYTRTHKTMPSCLATIMKAVGETFQRTLAWYKPESATMTISWNKKEDPYKHAVFVIKMVGIKEHKEDK